MIGMRLCLVLLIGLAACKSQDPPKPTDCAKVIPPAIDKAMADYKNDPRVVAVIDKAKQEMVALCTADKWKGIVGTCIERAKNRAELDGCRGGLDKEQIVRLNDVNARLRGAIQQSGAKPPAPEAPASGSGSAAGSGK
jgi:hypothetical protein